jgi:hypothetical protein
MDFAWPAYCSVGPLTESQLEKEPPNRAGATISIASIAASASTLRFEVE